TRVKVLSWTKSRPLFCRLDQNLTRREQVRQLYPNPHPPRWLAPGGFFGKVPLQRGKHGITAFSVCFSDTLEVFGQEPSLRKLIERGLGKQVSMEIAFSFQNRQVLNDDTRRRDPAHTHARKSNF